jgi:gamma-glutamyltranspeptidase
MTLEDVARFKPIMADPWTPGSRSGEACATYRGYLVGPPDRAMFGLACNLMEAGDLRARGRPTQDGDALYYQMRIMQEIWHTGLDYRREDHDRLLSKEYAQKAWHDVETGPPRPFQGLFEGTCALVIVDPEGNVAAGTHSSTSAAYGIGLFVDGVIANRVTYGRGKDKLPHGLATNVWLFKDGRPALVVASPSRAFNEALIQNVANVVEYGMDLGTSVRQPRFGHTDEKYGGTQIEGDFSEPVIERVRKRGISLVEVSPLNDYMGSCHGVQLSSNPREIQGAADPRRRGMAKGIA